MDTVLALQQLLLESSRTSEAAETAGVAAASLLTADGAASDLAACRYLVHLWEHALSRYPPTTSAAEDPVLDVSSLNDVTRDLQQSIDPAFSEWAAALRASQIPPEQAPVPAHALAQQAWGAGAREGRDAAGRPSFQVPRIPGPPTAPGPASAFSRSTAAGAAAAQGRWAANPNEPPGRPAVCNAVDLTHDSADPADELPDSPGARNAAQFQSARQVLHGEQSRKRKHGGAAGGGGFGHEHAQPAFGQNMSDNRAAFGGGCPRMTGLSKRGHGVSGIRSGFVPPYLKKALEASEGPQGGGGSQAKAAGGKGASAQGEEESPYSEAAMALLAGPDGAMPEMILKLDVASVNTIVNDVLETSGKVQWDDIAGQQDAKSLIQELVVWPMLNPALFTGARAPPKGLLLFGPPGTGKTLIGKAIASNISATFFSISASSLTSKWIGEGEKLVKALFKVAEAAQPSVIFIDEVDSILTARKSDGEHESSRRMKTELLVQMDGCDPGSAERRVLIIGATNRPEELDEAARRRLPKQLYVPLPCGEARLQMIVRQVGPGGNVRASLTDSDLAKVVEKTEGYSGSDMKNLIQEACQGPVREAVTQHGAAVTSLKESDLRPVLLKDFRAACQVQKASVQSEEITRYVLYDQLHGAKSSAALPCAADEDEW